MNDPIPGRFPDLPVDPQGPSFEEELEEAADLLAQQEPPPAERLRPDPGRPDPAGPIDYADPSLIDPAD
jgi:hypothetical protein